MKHSNQEILISFLISLKDEMQKKERKINFYKQAVFHICVSKRIDKNENCLYIYLVLK